MAPTRRRPDITTRPLPISALPLISRRRRRHRSRRERPTSPGYQHVFLFYFENENYSQVIGNTKQAPYLNSLRGRGATLTNFYAEEHPSDANYLALAGGSAFGVPLTDPAEENPLYTVGAANIGDLVTGSGEAWKAYLQSANGPCADTKPAHVYPPITVGSYPVAAAVTG